MLIMLYKFPVWNYLTSLLSKAFCPTYITNNFKQLVHRNDFLRFFKRWNSSTLLLLHGGRVFVGQNNNQNYHLTVYKFIVIK